MPRPPHASLLRAKSRLDPLGLYPLPVRLQRVRLMAAPWLFRLPWLRRFDGYATHRVIFVRTRAHLSDGDLVTHELCHVWQMQHRPLRMPLSYLRVAPSSVHDSRPTAATMRTRAPAPCP
jgi:hypothetical protein